MKKNIRALIFDVDGTLSETEELHRKAFNFVFEEEKIEWYWDFKLYKKLLNVSGGKERIDYFQETVSTGKKVLARKEVEKVHQRKTLLYNSWVKEGILELRPGIKKIITMAKKKKLILAISTSTSFENVNSLIRASFEEKPEKLFHFISTGDLVSKKKPYPDLYELVLKNISVDPNHCFALEDSRLGLLSSKAAKIPTIVCPSLYNLDDNFSEADYILESFRFDYLPKDLRDNLSS